MDYELSRSWGASCVDRCSIRVEWCMHAHGDLQRHKPGIHIGNFARHHRLIGERCGGSQGVEALDSR
jgi:hypothetical protein